MMMTAAPIRYREREKTPIVCFSGELDLSDAPWFERELERTRGESPSLIVDAGAITYVDSAILIALLRADRRCRVRGGRLIVARPRPALSRLFQVTGLSNVFQVLGDLETALALAD